MLIASILLVLGGVQLIGNDQVETIHNPAPTVDAMDALLQPESLNNASGIKITNVKPGATLKDTVTLKGTLGNPAEVERIELKVDDGKWKQIKIGANWSIKIDTKKFQNGKHVLTVRTTNATGETKKLTLQVTFKNKNQDQNPSQSDSKPTTSNNQTTTTNNSPTPNPPLQEKPLCLSRDNTIKLVGLQGQYKTRVADGSAIDARTATWTTAEVGDQHSVHFRYYPAENNNLCWQGGTILGDWAPGTPWSFYHGVTALRVRGSNFKVDGIRIDKNGDGIGFSEETASNWTIKNAHLTNIHDDCVENDYMHNGLLDDSLLDGCYTALSATGHSGMDSPPNGLSKTWMIRDSLIRLKPMDAVYKGPVPGHGRFFKWSNNHPEEGYGTKLSIHNTIFRADQLPNSGDLGMPFYEDPITSELKSYVKDCSNNTMVWLGPGSFPESLPSCFTVTKNKSVWDSAVANWKARH